ncbi:ADP-ribosylation factor-binding protein GGA3 isoform X2 [Neoarius graeffei]|uniref:ADP-ribosylation factor-binding protein GGA3 isoform X2 n=1 Tax=Neoarius graeffei TaxID=443677 RepID=UPI00298C136E|nr:ADP-ribosylation factor-binding protein GGA3 isoform X2 [Neoarius graeffei]
MAYQEGETLESWLNKATHPTNRQEDWEYIIGFCDQINKELEGPQIAIQLLVHKIHSPQEWEALQALTVLEACMKNCGRRFHNEVAKYRFLNELIKVVSPKYMGEGVSERVKTKIIEMLYSWTVAFPNEAKISEAYQTLRRQGLISSDPELTADKTLIPSPPSRPKNPVFDNEDMGKLLAELLRSKNPEDLQEANRLIKNMVKEDDARVQKMTKRMNTLEEVNNNVKLLSEMLSHYDQDRSSDADRDLIKELYERCDKLRRTAFKLATETEDHDTSLGEILQASDELERVINLYKKVVKGETEGETTEEQKPALGKGCETDTLIDLAGLDELPAPQTAPPTQVSRAPLTNQTSCSIPVIPPPPRRLAGGSASQTSSPIHKTSEPSPAHSLLDDELLSLGLNEPPPVQSRPKLEDASNKWTSLQAPAPPGLDLFSDEVLSSGTALPPPHTSGHPTHHDGVNQGLQDLAMLNLGEVKSVSGQPTMAAGVGLGFAVPSSLSSSNPFISSTMPGSPLRSLQGNSVRSEASLSNLHVPLDSIKTNLDIDTPTSWRVLFTWLAVVKGFLFAMEIILRSSTTVVSCKALPVTAYDKDGVRVLLHFGSECPPGRPDVLVIVVSMLNTAPLAVKNIELQAAVPKSMKVKLQSPSGAELTPFNPILPPSSITQVMLLANPLKEKVRLRYKLMFLLGERQYCEVGELDQFPPPERWGNL